MKMDKETAKKVLKIMLTVIFLPFQKPLQESYLNVKKTVRTNT